MRTPYAFDARCQGASHMRRNKECQDYSAHFQDERWAAAVVCDGHGGSDYVRSGVGAKLASDAAMKQIQSFVDKVDVARLKNADEREDLLLKLKKRIIDYWKRAVREYHAKYPFTEEEMSGLSDKARKRYFEEGRLEVAYGTTLLAAVCAKNYWFGLHIGDGRCVYVDRDGIFREIPLDERCFLNATTSICDTDALTRFHHVFEESLPAAVFVCCDGVDGSFDNAEKLYNFYKTILYSFASEQPEDAEDGLREFLPRLSANGSGDDVSIAAVLDLDAIKNLEMVRDYDPGKAKARKEENLRREARRNEQERKYQTETANLKNEIRDFKTRLYAKERELAQADEDLSEQTRQIENLTLKQTQQEQEKRELEKELAQLREREIVIKRRVAEIEESINRAQGPRREAEYQQRRLTNERKAVKQGYDSLKRTIDEKEFQLEQIEDAERKRLRESTMKEREEELRRKEEETARAREALDRQKEALDQKQEALDQQQEALDQKEEDLNQRTAAVKDKENSLARKEEELTSQNPPSAEPTLPPPQPVMPAMPPPQYPAPMPPQYPISILPQYAPPPQTPTDTPAPPQISAPPENAGLDVETLAQSMNNMNHEQLLKLESLLASKISAHTSKRDDFRKIKAYLDSQDQNNAQILEQARLAETNINKEEQEVQKFAGYLKETQTLLQLRRSPDDAPAPETTGQ